MIRRSVFGWRNAAALTPAGVTIAFTLLVLLGTRWTISEMHAVEQSYEALGALDGLLVRIQEAENGQRGYVITGDSTFLAAYLEASARIESQIEIVRDLLVEPDERARFELLVPSIRERVEVLDRQVRLRAEGQVEAAMVGIRSGYGAVLMDGLRVGIGDLREMRRRDLEERQALRHRGEQTVLMLLLGGSAITIGLAVAVNGTLLTQARNLRTAAIEAEEKHLELEDQAVQLEHQATELEAQTAELEEALESVRENEELFRSLIEHSTDLIAVVDDRGRFVFQSPSVSRVLRWADESDSRQSLLEEVHLEDRALVLSEFERVRRDPGHVAGFEMRCRDGEGNWRVLQVTARRLEEPSVVTGTVINAQDITESRRLEEQFRHAQRMEAVGRLAGGVAHDFSNILGIIKGNVQLLQLDLEPSSQIHEDLQLVNQAADRAAGLVRQLLAFSRKQVLQPQLIDLNELVTETEKMLCRVIGSDIELRTRLEPELGWVNADPGQMQQILMNLAVNSRDAMPRGGKLLIETRNIEIEEGLELLYPHLPAGSPAVLLAVHDTGTGMDEEVQKHIFEPFFSTKEPGKGTGLGLSTVYGIVKQSRGYIWVESAPGSGTTFRIYLPRITLTPQLGDELPPQIEASEGRGTVLVVEDEPQLRVVMCRLLERQGFAVLQAENGPEALRLVQAGSPHLDLVVADMVMPQMSGTELARRLRGYLPQLRVLFVSGHTDDTVNRMGHLPVGSTFIQKPFDSNDFLRAVTHLVGVDPS